MAGLHRMGGVLADSSELEQVASTCETVQEIINIAVTAEAFAVTALGGAIANAEAGILALNAEQIQTLKAARAAEQTHYDYLIGAGAVPLTTTFTIPDEAIVTDVPTFLTTLITLEEVFIAAYIAAAQEFAILGEARLAQVALQIGAVEAEHRVGVRFYAIEAGILSGTPNDVAFEKALFSSVGEAATALMDLGFIGGSGTEITYPGPGEIDYTGVTNLQP
ncbi:MAG: ferritin-like domain-containing protein [Chloroflexota bacterium]|nr:ferritin-like domain-containing protein [Chloroflexota bacterium]